MTTQTLERTSTFPLTEAQIELWLLSQVSDQASCAFNECSSIELRGNVDEAALTRALGKVVQRNELLRATVDRAGEQLIVHEAPRTENHQR